MIVEMKFINSCQEQVHKQILQGNYVFWRKILIEPKYKNGRNIG